MKQTNLKWKRVEDYVDYLIKDKKRVDPIIFLQIACQIKKELIDSFLIYTFVKIYEEDCIQSFCIHHTRLVELQILSSVYDMDSFLKKLELVEKKDYIQLGDLYLLSPVVFQYCLFSSKHGKKYTYQFALLERWMHQYQLYIHKLQHEILWDESMIRRILQQYQSLEQKEKNNELVASIEHKIDLIVSFMKRKQEEDQEGYALI